MTEPKWFDCCSHPKGEQRTIRVYGSNRTETRAKMTARLRLRRDDGRVYLERWGIEHRRIGGVFVHRMTAPDPGLDLHDHPWSFVSIVLRGGYVEERMPATKAIAQALWCERSSYPIPRGVRSRRRLWSIRRTPLDVAHRIIDLNRSSSWSIVLHGPRRREWGFHTPDGFVVWTDYDESRRGLGLE